MKLKYSLDFIIKLIRTQIFPICYLKIKKELNIEKVLIKGKNLFIKYYYFSLNQHIIFGNNSFNSFIQILNQRPLSASQIFPYDGILESNQFVKIGAILEGDNYDAKTFSMKLGGAKVRLNYNPENKEISFTPSKPLIKKSYIVNITALDKNSPHTRKISWLITIK